MNARVLIGLLAAGVLLAFAAEPITTPAAGATSVSAKRQTAKRSTAKQRTVRRRAASRRAARRTGPYGFLPGYRPPEVVEHEEALRSYDRPFYALPEARFHRGRWNGGGFGPCYTYTPIGPVWNCGGGIGP